MQAVVNRFDEQVAGAAVRRGRDRRRSRGGAGRAGAGCCRSRGAAAGPGAAGAGCCGRGGCEQRSRLPRCSGRRRRVGALPSPLPAGFLGAEGAGPPPARRRVPGAQPRPGGGGSLRPLCWAGWLGGAGCCPPASYPSQSTWSIPPLSGGRSVWAAERPPPCQAAPGAVA